MPRDAAPPSPSSCPSCRLENPPAESPQRQRQRVAHRTRRTVLTALCLCGIAVFVALCNGLFTASTAESTVQRHIAQLPAAVLMPSAVPADFSRAAEETRAVVVLRPSQSHLSSADDVQRFARRVSSPPRECVESAKYYAGSPLPAIVVLTGVPRGRSLENALRQVVLPLCAYVVALQPEEACTAGNATKVAADATGNETAAGLSYGTLAVEAEGGEGAVAGSLFAAENGIDARLHVEDRGECLVPGSSVPRFPFRWFNWTVERICADPGSWPSLIQRGAKAAGFAQPAQTFVVPVHGSTSFRFGRQDAQHPDVDPAAGYVPVSRVPCRVNAFCASSPATARACARRRLHVHALRRRVLEQDAWLTGATHAVWLDAPPSSCSRVRNDAGEPRRPRLAVGITGEPRTVGTAVRRMERFMQSTQWYIFAHVSVTRPLTARAARELADLRARPNVLGFLISDVAVDPNMTMLTQDHPRGPYLRTHNETNVTRTLVQFYNFAVTNLLRRMYEERCGVRFDLAARMRTDTFFNHALNASWALDESTLLIDAERAPYPRSINDQFAVGPPWLLDRVLDIYFRLPEVAFLGFHPESALYELLRLDDLHGFVKQPPFRMVELYRSYELPEPSSFIQPAA